MIKKDWHKLVEPVLKRAGSIVFSYWNKPLQLHMKQEGFYTQADIASEQFLIKELGTLLPEATMWAEESGMEASNESGYRWVIDPLDGTTNFAHSIPYFCISVALTYNDIPVFGAIYSPITDELFHAQAGNGAFLNGKPIRVSDSGSVSKAIIGFGLAYKNSQRVPVVDLAQKMADKAYGVRHLGAVALDLAFVAAGRLDGVVFTNLSWWDVAAGVLLIQEAGGRVATFEGAPIGPDFKTCIGGDERIWQELSGIVANR